MEYLFDHTHLYAPDPGKTAAWYRDILGAKPIEENKTPKMLMIHLNLGGTRLIISGPAARPGSQIDEPHQGLDHFGMKVPDLEAAIRDLKGKGVKFLQELTVTPSGGKISFMEAPDKTRIELTERK